ncbi:MAG: hypothetical protein ACREEB_02720 [Caulobacteraceae bacterium]
MPEDLRIGVEMGRVPTVVAGRQADAVEIVQIAGAVRSNLIVVGGNGPCPAMLVAAMVGPRSSEFGLDGNLA